MPALSISTLKTLRGAGVGSLVVHGAVDLDAFCSTLQSLASTPGACIPRIEACCMLTESTHFGPILARLAGLGDATRVYHRPLSITVPGYWPLTAKEAGRLASLGTSSSMPPIAVSIPVQHDDGELARQSAIDKSGERLSVRGALRMQSPSYLDRPPAVIELEVPGNLPHETDDPLRRETQPDGPPPS